MTNILEPALEPLKDSLQDPVSQEWFLTEFKRAAENVAKLLKEQPAIVAHSQNTFDGSGIRRLMSNKFELDKVSVQTITNNTFLIFCLNLHDLKVVVLSLQALESGLKSVPRDRHGKISKDCLGVALDNLAASAGLPPLGAVDQVRSYARF